MFVYLFGLPGRRNRLDGSVRSPHRGRMPMWRRRWKVSRLPAVGQAIAFAR